MIQRRDGFGFTLKSLAELRAGDFDRDDAIQPRVSGAIHFSHTARTDGRKDFVRPEFIAGRKLHMMDGAESSPLRSGKGTIAALWGPLKVPVVKAAGAKMVFAFCSPSGNMAV
jgi:hypothetical protein